MKIKKFFVLIILLVAAFLTVVGFSAISISAGEDLALSPSAENEAGWDLYTIIGGEKTAISYSDALIYPGTIYMEREVAKDWIDDGYNEVLLASGRQYCVFIEGNLVYTTNSGMKQLDEAETSRDSAGFEKIEALDGEDSLISVNFPFENQLSASEPGFYVSSDWADKNMIIASALYTDQQTAKIDFTLTSDSIKSSVAVSNTLDSTVPTIIFAILAFLFLAMFLYKSIMMKFDIGLLLLTFAAASQILYYTNFYSLYERGWAIGAPLQAIFCFIPMLYLLINMKRHRKPFAIALIVAEAFYLAKVIMINVLLMDVLSIVNMFPCVFIIPLIMLLIYGTKEQRQKNPIFKTFMPCLWLSIAAAAICYGVSVWQGIAFTPYIDSLFANVVSGAPQKLLLVINNLFMVILLITIMADIPERLLKTAKSKDAFNLNNQLDFQRIHNLSNRGESLEAIKERYNQHLRELAVNFNTSPEKGNEYLSTVLQDSGSDVQQKYSVNPIVNAIMIVAASKSRSQDVDLETVIDVPETMGISDFDLSVIIMNLLDNAVAAAKQAPDEVKSKVSLKMNLDDENLNLIIKNPEPEDFDEDEFLSSNKKTYVYKANEENLGIEHVRDTLSKYRASLDYYVDEDNMIITEVKLPM